MSRGWKTTLVTTLALAAWSSATIGGLAVLWHYSATAAPVQAPPAFWPRESALRPPADRPTVVLFLHPKCPCSRATIAELAEIMARVGDKAAVTVLLLRPERVGDEWADTALARKVAALPHVTVGLDAAGVEAGVFGATTSGETFVYDARGRLQFHGGITGARGHIGDNAGRAAVQAVVLCGAGPVTVTSTFGCPLHATAPATHSNFTP